MGSHWLGLLMLGIDWNPSAYNQSDQNKSYHQQSDQNQID